MNFRRRKFSGNHHALAGARLQIGSHALQILRLMIGPAISARAARANRPCQRLRTRRHLARLHRQPMLRLEPRRRGHALDHVQPVHLLRALELPLLRVIPRQLVESRERRAAQKIRIQRHNHVRLIQPVLRVHEAPKRLLRRRVVVVPVHRLILHQLRLRIILLRLLPLCSQRRRGHRPAQEIQSLPARRLLVRQHRAERRQKRRP